VGLQALRRSDGLWVPVEEAPARQDGALVMMVMVGDTLGYLTRQHYAPAKHRVNAPPPGPGGAPNERIGLPFLFRGRSDAVLNTSSAIAAAKAAGRPSHLAEMETTTIKELPAFDSAKSILRNWRLHGVPPKGWAVEK
jgi:isopenicillin N synthase-like dioxygenase